MPKSQLEINVDLAAQLVVYRSILISLCVATFGSNAAATQTFLTSLNRFQLIGDDLNTPEDLADSVNAVIEEFRNGFRDHYQKVIIDGNS